MTSPQAAAPAPATTGSRGTRVLGGLTLAGIALLLAYALVWSPADREMHDSVRLMYAHVPSAIVAYTGCAITTLASAMWLRRRSEGWWVLAGAAAEVATVFTALALVTGSIWGRPTWGTYWEWDPRITSTTLAVHHADRRPGPPAHRQRVAATPPAAASAARSSGCCSSRTS